jgi:hypothetical protein
MMRVSNVSPDNNKIKVFNKGIPQGSKTEKMPTGGQNRANLYCGR